MIFRRIVRATAWLILSLVLFVSVWLLAALAIPLITINPHPITGKDVTIFIQTNGDHTDLVVPAVTPIKDWRSEISYQHTTGGDSTKRYIAIGWGDKEFYLKTPTWSQLKFKVAFKAVFGLNTGAIHATLCDSLHENKDCKKIMLTNTQYQKLVAYIDSAFKRDTGGRVINIKTNAYGPDDSFYEAKGRLSLFYTCNTWANNALKACGRKACLWTALDIGIFYHYC